MTTTPLVLCALVGLALAARAHAAPEEPAENEPRTRLSPEQVARFARVAVAGITREYPNKPSDVLLGPGSLQSPRTTHPAFYGSFDWHSSVHGHWMLVRLLRLYPDLAVRAEVVNALDGNLTAANCRMEAATFDAPERRSFERTYGWAWLLCLARELREWDDEHGRRWALQLRPLETRIVELWKAYLPKQAHPIRSGEHRDSAFALAFALDYARAVEDVAFERLLLERARAWYADDADYPLRYEPSGHDFFSAGLNEADLMRRVLAPAAYGAWLDRFLPGLRRRDLGPVAVPAAVDDVTDGKLVHLAGLNLTRAWTLRGIAGALVGTDPRRAWLEEVAAAHTRAGLDSVFSGHYAGEHWLASFAVFLLTDAGL